MSDGGRWKGLALPVVGLAVLAAVAFGFGHQKKDAGPVGATERLRLGYFPNVTHAPAIAGVERGKFQEALGASVALDPKVFNAGPEEMEALLAGEIDLGYVGPSPAINTFLKSNGKALRVLAGACSGGAALVARGDTTIRSIQDLDGKRLAVPQLGGTQDVSARHFLAEKGLRPKEKGGTVQVMPVKNPDTLALFKQRQIDAAWVPEPWASRLIAETGARLVVDERDLWPDRKFTTTVVVGRTAYVDQHPGEVTALLQAHLKSVEWLTRNPDAGRKSVNAELKRLTGKQLPEAILTAAWERVEFTSDPNEPSVAAFVRYAAAAGYLPEQGVAVASLFDLKPLAEARRTLQSARLPAGQP
jgi:NitT/TauT family transport system substrate-binding protein